MSATSPDLKDRVASKAVTPSNGAAQPTIYDLINRQKAQVALALPNSMDPDRFTRLVITQVKQTPKLAECTPQSLLASFMLAAQLGVEPGPLGHCYLIPRRNKGVMEVQFQLGYKGIIDLARRSGTIQSIEAREVCENDDFTFALEANPPFHHTWDLHRPRGEAYAFYGFARFKDGGHYFLILNREEVEQRRARSATANSDMSPWRSDYLAMARKTVIRAMQPYLPLSAEVARQMMTDETTRREYTPDMAETFVEQDYIDVDTVDTSTGEIGSGQPPADAPPPPDEGAPIESTATDNGAPIDYTVPLPRAEQDKLRKALVKRIADSKALGDEHLQAVIRHMTMGERSLPSDLVSALDFSKINGCLDDVDAGSWVFVNGDDGKLKLVFPDRA